jgi:hypothetical protein
MLLTPAMSTPSHAQGYTTGQPIVGNSTNVLASSPLFLDATQFPGAPDVCAQIDAAFTAAGTAGISTVDGRGFPTAATCSPTNANATFSHATGGSTLLLGKITLTLGTGGTAGTPAWTIPNMVRVRGVSPALTIIQADNTGCTNPNSTTCTNWVVRFGTISSVSLSGTGNHWVTLTMSAQPSNTPVAGELAQVQSTSPGPVFDSNWGMFRICASGNPNNNGGCPGNPTTTTIGFYNSAAVNTSNGGSVFFGTPLIAFGKGAVAQALSPINANQVVLENVAVFCNSIPGCIGVQNVAAQEQSSMLWVTARGSSFANFDIHNGGSSGAGNSGPYVGLYSITQGSTGDLCNKGTIGMYVAESATRSILGATVTANSCTFAGYNPKVPPVTGTPTSQPAAGVMIEGSTANIPFEQFHVEQFDTGIEIGQNLPTKGVHVNGMVGASNVLYCVDVSNNFSTTGANQTGALIIERINIGSTSTPCAQATIRDNIRGNVIVSPVVSLYAWDNNTSVNLLSTDGSIPTLLGGGLAIGTGTTLARYARYAVTESPAAVAANTCAAQSFNNITGIVTGDILIGVHKPTEQAGLSVTPGHVTATNTATVNFCNNTAAVITPTASQTYNFVVVQ